MNEVIQRCIDELSKPDVKTDYIKGLLEGALAMNNGNIFHQAPKLAQPAQAVGSTFTTEVPSISPTLLAELKQNEEKAD